MGTLLCGISGVTIKWVLLGAWVAVALGTCMESVVHPHARGPHGSSDRCIIELALPPPYP